VATQAKGSQGPAHRQKLLSKHAKTPSHWPSKQAKTPSHRVIRVVGLFVLSVLAASLSFACDCFQASVHTHSQQTSEYVCKRPQTRAVVLVLLQLAPTAQKVQPEQKVYTLQYLRRVALQLTKLDPIHLVSRLRVDESLIVTRLGCGQSSTTRYPGLP
jgi:hypothetical protein